MAENAPALSGRQLPPWARLPIAMASGAVMALAMAPHDMWYFGISGLIAAMLLFKASPGGLRAVGTGWAVGLGYFGLALGWIVEPFMVDAATTGWMAPFALVGMAGGLALFWALPFWAAAHSGKWGLPVLVTAWAASELARGYVLTGFPWALISYIWAPVASIQWVSVLGPYGLTFVTLVMAALAASALWRGDLRRGVASVMTFAAIFVGGWALTPPEQDLTGQPVVRLIQPNAAQHEKWQREMIPVFFNRQVSFTSAPPTQGLDAPALVIWPETALPMLLGQAADSFDMITQAGKGAQMVLGIQRAEGGNYYNSLVTLDGAGTVAQVYDKHHLVPFGEYMPAAAVFQRWNIFGLAARAEGGYAAGPGPRMLDLGPLGLALPLICYEAVFPQDVYRAPVRPAMLLQITNDAWFGQWSGPYQHLAQARIRAIEQGLPMLRAANTGVSAVIDGAGRTLAALPLGEAGFVDAPVPPPLRRTLYSRSGDLPFLAFLFLCGGALAFAVMRNSD
jgi:apolipoprotein N-acyltransferase